MYLTTEEYICLLSNYISVTILYHITKEYIRSNEKCRDFYYWESLWKKSLMASSSSLSPFHQGSLHQFIVIKLKCLHYVVWKTKISLLMKICDIIMKEGTLKVVIIRIMSGLEWIFFSWLHWLGPNKFDFEINVIMGKLHKLICWEGRI